MTITYKVAPINQTIKSTPTIMNNPIDQYDTELRRALNEVLVSMLKDHNWKVTCNAGNPIMYLAGTDTTVTSLEGI